MQIGSQAATAFKIGAQNVDRIYRGATLIFEAVPVTTVATTGGAGEIIFNPVAGLDRWTAAAGGDGEVVFTTVDGTGTLEAFYRLKSAGGAFTRVTGTSPITVTGLGSATEYEFLTGDDTVADVTSGGFLEEYPGAAGAWSLRALSSSTTDVVRVRRDSDDAEQDFTHAEVTDGTLTTFAGAGNGFVVTLYDQSGNGADATDATQSRQPQIVDTGALVTRNSEPAMLWTPTKSLSTSGQLLPTNEWAAFAIVDRDDNASNQFALGQHEDGVTSRTIMMGFDQDTLAHILITFVTGSAPYGEGTTTLPAALAVAETQAFGDDYYVAVDGEALEEVITASPYTPSNSPVTLGNTNSTGTSGLNGALSEVILYSSDRQTERTNINAALKSHYGTA